MANYYGRIRQAYGVGQSLQGIFPSPIVTAGLAPTINDQSEVGQLWFNTSANTMYALTSINGSGQAQWQLMASASAGGTGGAFNGTTITASGAVNFQNASLTLSDASFYNGALITNGAGLVSAASGSTTSVLLGQGVGSVPAFGAVTSTGGTISITRSGANLNLEFSGALTPYTTVVGATTALVANTGYLINYAGVATLNLPNVTAVGQVIEIQQLDATPARGHQIALNGNTLVYGGQTPTTLTFLNRAATGSAAANLYGNICLISIAANTWAVFGQPMGTYAVA